MGCCVSHDEENNKNRKQNSLQDNNQLSSVSKSPPRPEEECVKEVLTETPTPSKLNPKPDYDPNITVPKCDPKQTYPKQKLLSAKDMKYYSDPSTPEDEIPQVSEMHCARNTAAVYKSQGNYSSFLKSNCNSYNTDHNVQLKTQRRSPVRRANPSPPRRYSSPSPGSSQVGLRRDMVGENSARRSQSPTMSRSNVGRSVSARRTGTSPGRVRMVHGPEEVRKVENGIEWNGPKESLENPLVSLECFIFL